MTLCSKNANPPIPSPGVASFFPAGGETLSLEATAPRAAFLLCASSDRRPIRAARRGVDRDHARTPRRNLDYVLTRDRGLMAQVPGLALVAD